MTSFNDFIEKCLLEILTHHKGCLWYISSIGLNEEEKVDLNADDVMEVDAASAYNLYVKDFYIHPGICRLPIDLQQFMFDSSLHHGPARAIMFLQEALNHWIKTKLIVDGRYGPKTRQVIDDLCTVPGFELNQLLSVMVSCRKNYFRQIIGWDPAQGVFYEDWVKRAESFLVTEG